MDILTTTNIVAAFSLAGSAGLMAIAARRYKNAGDVERQAGDRVFDRALELSSSRIEQLEEDLQTRDEVIDGYYNQLVLDQKTIVMASMKIREMLTAKALTDEMFADIDLVLRRYHPELPTTYEPAEAIDTMLEAALGQSFVESFIDSPEDGKRVIAELLSRLTSTLELREGELADTRMKHEHAMEVIFKRNDQLIDLQGQFDAQAEVITELREEKQLAEVELTATTVVAQDDSADADRYADDLRKADEVIEFLKGELKRAGREYAPTIEMTETMDVSARRQAVRDDHSRGPGAAIVRLAA